MEEKIKCKIAECGLYIHPVHHFLGASPDFKIEDMNCLVEIKCFPLLPMKKRLQKWINNGEKVLKTFWKHDHKHMHHNHKFFFQIQGQLAVTNYDTCIFAVFKQTEVDLGDIIEELE